MSEKSNTPKITKKDLSRIASRQENGENAGHLINQAVRHSTDSRDRAGRKRVDTSRLDPRIFPKDQPDWMTSLKLKSDEEPESQEK